MDKIPSFNELPVKPGAPPESSWGVFGDDDGIGCLNFLTPAGVVEAAGLIRSGKVFRWMRSSVSPSRICSAARL